MSNDGSVARERVLIPDSIDAVVLASRRNLITG
jgi:hypothetical protein